LQVCCELQRNQGNHTKALAFAEEWYDCVAVAYNPVHPDVQKAASSLIICLLCEGFTEKAETFAEFTLASLKDPKNGLDQQSEELAQGYIDLAYAIHERKGDLVKAERLLREACRIVSQIYGNFHINTTNPSDILAKVLQSQGKLGPETKELVERSVAINTTHSGPEGLNTAIAYDKLGSYYLQLADTDPKQTFEMRRKNINLSKLNYKEAFRIFVKIFGPCHAKCLELVPILHRLSLA
jgi:tetratricopeptide (TPR) repeat protein